MMPLRTRLRSDRLRAFGIVVIAVLALASAGHIWHHLTDEACENPRDAFPHPCAQCAGLHGGVVAEAIQAAPAPRLVDHAAVFLGQDLDRVEQSRGTASPRAPPLS
ncbi:MAG TPA: hypothetical protein VFQ05_13895 [Candidatus Eisenbacteria bacterium]|nr:hypothetical protein [Candidatus Eisenbacteria bacterium]